MPTGWFARVRSQGTELWSKLSTPVKLLVVGLGLAGILAAVMAAQSGQPQYVALPGQPFDPKDLTAVVAQLGEMNVPYRQSADGTMILVPAEQLLNARMALAQAGVSGGPVGYELFDSPSLTATDFERRVNLLRAQEGELSRAIAAMEPVRSATVKLAIPEKSVFVREQKPVKAAVMIEPRSGRTLSADEVEGIVRFLAWSVPELDPENVMVVDQTGRTLMAGLRPEELDARAAGPQLEKQLAYQREVEGRLTRLLERQLGPGNVSVMASVKLRFESSREVQTRYEQPGANGEPVVRSEQRQTFSFEGQGPPPDLPAGFDANSPVPPTYAGADTGGTSTYEGRNSTTNYEINETHVETQRLPGQVESISVGVFVNEAIISAADTERLAQLQQVVASAAGTPVEMVSVATMPFNNDLVAALMAQPEASEGLSWQLVAGGGLAAAAVFFILLFIMRRRQAAQAPITAGVPDTDAEDLVASVRRAASDQPSTPSDHLEAQLQLLGKDFVDQLGADPARMKLKDEVEKVARQNPEMAASMVKAWLAEES